MKFIFEKVKKVFDTGSEIRRIRSTPSGRSSLRKEKTNCVGALKEIEYL